MKAARISVGVMVFALLLGMGNSIDFAQERVERERLERIEHRFGNDVLRVGQDFVLRPGETVREVMVGFTDATIEGHVQQSVGVLFGSVRIRKTAVIDGTLFVFGGSATIEQGATIRQDLVVIGGGLEAPPGFSPGQQFIVVGEKSLAQRLRYFVPWLTDGLLLGRPIVPHLEWVWAVVAMVFFVSLVLNLMFMDGVRRSADVIATKPISTFLVGILVLLLTGPAAVLLAASVIGLAVVPFLLGGVLIAWLIGKVAVAVRVGDSIIGRGTTSGRVQTVGSFVIGSVIIYITYMIPVLGFTVWALVGVTGLGAASVAFLSAYRRENRAAAKAAVAPPPSAPRPEPVAPPFTSPVYAAPAAAMAAPAPPFVASAPFAEPEIPVVTPPPPATAAVEPPPALPPGSMLAFPHAGFIERAGAFIIDTILVFGVNEFLELTRPPGGPMFLLLLYHIGFWTWKGTTLGGIMCQLRLIRVDGAPVRFAEALVRALSAIFSILPLGVGCLWMLKDPQRQTWHDKIAGTYVVTVPRNWPLP